MKNHACIHSLQRLVTGRAHAFTVDVEDWFHGIPISAAQTANARRRLEFGLIPLLELLRRHSIQATFFVLGIVAKAQPDLVRRIATAGHEIACHGWAHEPLYQTTRSRFRMETARAKDLLEQIIGAEVAGYRAAYFSITEKTLWALDELIELGFSYDSSIFPIRNWRYGIADFPREPTRIQTRSGAINEFPITVRNACGIPLPVSGGAYFRVYPYALTAYLFERTATCGKNVVFYIHPWELDANHPRIAFDWRAWLTHYANLSSTRHKLERLTDAFQFESLRMWQHDAVASLRRTSEEVVVADGGGRVWTAADVSAPGSRFFGIGKG